MRRTQPGYRPAGRRFAYAGSWCITPCMQAEKADTRLAGLALLAVTVTGWALNWAFIKLLLREWPPLFSRGVSGVAAALLLAALARARGDGLRVPSAAWPALLFGAGTNGFAG